MAGWRLAGWVGGWLMADGWHCSAAARGFSWCAARVPNGGVTNVFSGRKFRLFQSILEGKKKVQKFFRKFRFFFSVFGNFFFFVSKKLIKKNFFFIILVSFHCFFFKFEANCGRCYEWLTNRPLREFAIGLVNPLGLLNSFDQLGEVLITKIKPYRFLSPKITFVT